MPCFQGFESNAIYMNNFGPLMLSTCGTVVISDFQHDDGHYSPPCSTWH